MLVRNVGKPNLGTQDHIPEHLTPSGLTQHAVFVLLLRLQGRPNVSCQEICYCVCEIWLAGLKWLEMGSSGGLR